MAIKNWLFACLLSSLIWNTSVVAQEDEVAEAVAEAAPAGSTNSSDAGPSSPAVRPITLSVNLVDESTVMTGTLVDANTLSIKTAFGQAELPLTEVAGVRFPRGEDTATTVVMLNGDSITGATDLKFVSLETTWGSAKINGQSISSMLFVPGLAWQPIDVLGSRRWQLVEVQAVANNPQISQPSTTQPSNRTVTPGLAAPGQTIQGQPIQGQPIPGQPVPGQPRLLNPTPSGNVRINN